MRQYKLGIAGLCAAIFAMMAMSVGVAQAALSWLVLNSSETVATELKAALVAEKIGSSLTLLTKVIGLMVSVTCANRIELVGVNLETGGKLTTGGKVKFTECELYEGGAFGKLLCEAHSEGLFGGVIETNKLKGELVLHTLPGGGTEVLGKIEAEVKKGNLVNIFFDKECLFTSFPVNGVLYVKDFLGQATTHAAKHLIEQGPLTSLVFGETGSEINLIGSVWASLGSAHKGLKWSAMDV